MTTPQLWIPTDAGERFEDGPDRGRIVVFGRDTGGRYSLMEYIVAPGEEIAPDAARRYGAHLHREIEETFLVQEGVLEFLLGHAVITLRAGDFVRVPPGTRHGYANTSDAAVKLLVSFVPGGFEELFVKYRSDGAGEASGEGFVAEATRDHASEFERE